MSVAVTCVRINSGFLEFNSNVLQFSVSGRCGTIRLECVNKERVVVKIGLAAAVAA